MMFEAFEFVGDLDETLAVLRAGYGIEPNAATLNKRKRRMIVNKNFRKHAAVRKTGIMARKNVPLAVIFVELVEGEDCLRRID